MGTFGALTTGAVSLRLVMATVMGGLIGIERASKKRSAGLRTFALVCLGSAITMVINEYVDLRMGSGDPVRLAAQVISGIGFLGMGTIIVTDKSHVKGLTTAATLWTTATLGIAVGSGYLAGSLVCFLLIIFTVRILAYISRYQEVMNREIDLYVEVDRETGLTELVQYLRKEGYTIYGMQLRKQKSMLVRGDLVVTLELDMKRRINHRTVIETIEQLESIHYIEEMM